MLTIFSCLFFFFAICVSSLETISFNLLPIFWIFLFIYLFIFYIELHELCVYFGESSLVSHFVCKYFSPFCRLSLVFFMGFFAVQKLLRLIGSHLFMFYFIFITLGGAAIYVKESSPYVFI